MEQEPTETSCKSRLTISRNDRFRGIRRIFTTKTGKLPSFSFYALRGAENREEEKFSGKIFRVGTLLEKDPHPLKKKVFFDQFGRFFFGHMKIGEIVYGKLAGILFLKFFMENGLILLRGKFLIFFWIRGVLKFWAKNISGKIF